jgi:hypothetical protein
MPPPPVLPYLLLLLVHLPFVLPLLPACAAHAAVAPPADPGPSFSLAYVIPVTRATAARLPAFLSAVYHPQNTYLVALYSAAPPASALAHLPNVLVHAVPPTTPRGISEPLATVAAYASLLALHPPGSPPAYILTAPPTHAPLLPPSQTRTALAAAAAVTRSHHPLAAPPLFLRHTPTSSLRRFSTDEHYLHYDPALTFTRNSSALSAGLITSYDHSTTRLAHPDKQQRPLLPHAPADNPVLPSALAVAAVESVTAKRILLGLAETADAALRFVPALAAADPGVLVVDGTSLVCGPDAVADRVPRACLFAERTGDGGGGRGVAWGADAAAEQYRAEVTSLIVAEVEAAAAAAGKDGWRPGAPPLL